MTRPSDDKLSHEVAEAAERTGPGQASAPPPAAPDADRVSKTDAPTLGLWDTAKRRLANRRRTQRQADVEEAQVHGAWAPTPKTSIDAGPGDVTGVNPQGVVDESMLHPRKG